MQIRLASDDGPRTPVFETLAAGKVSWLSELMKIKKGFGKSVSVKSKLTIEQNSVLQSSYSGASPRKCKPLEEEELDHVVIKEEQNIVSEPSSGTDEGEHDRSIDNQMQNTFQCMKGSTEQRAPPGQIRLHF